MATARRAVAAAESEKPTAAADEKIVGHASIIAADGKLILFNDSGELILAKSNPDHYQELARASVLGGEICWTSPALHRGRLYLRNHSRAVCVHVGDPELLDRTVAARTWTVSDIPQGAPPDLSSILGIEPEYALDPPTFRWLWSWYGFSLGIIVLARIFSVAIHKLIRSPMSFAQRRWLFWGLVFLLGVAAARPLSIWRNDFVFTWPVSLFVAFQATAYQTRIGGRRQAPSGRAWRGRLVAAAFILVCGGYYEICRQLSLVTEWIFLCGFPGACVFVLWGRWFSRRPRQNLLAEAILTMVAFSAFFWSSVALLSLKYHIPDW